MRKLPLLVLLLSVILSIPPSLAVVTNQTTQTVSALGNGSSVNFTISFDFRDNSQLLVYLRETSSGSNVDTLLVNGSGAGKYTVTGGNPGTTVVMGTAPTTTQRVVINRSIPLTQPVSYDEASAFPAADHMTQMDQMVMMIQQLNSQVNLIGLSTLPALPLNQIYVGQSSGTPLPVGVTGDIAINSGGAVTIGPSAVTYSKMNLGGSVVNADISASAAIARSKIAGGSTYALVANTGTGVLGQIPVGTTGQVLMSLAGGNWGASTAPASPRAEFWAYTANGFGSVSTKIPRFATVGRSTVSFCVDNPSTGTTCTIPTTGLYAVTFGDAGSGGAISLGISLNASGADLAAALGTLSQDKIIAATYTAATDHGASTQVTALFTAGDVVRPHTDGAGQTTNGFNTFFRIVQINN